MVEKQIRNLAPNIMKKVIWWATVYESERSGTVPAIGLWFKKISTTSS